MAVKETEKSYSIPAKVDGSAFYSFALYDTFILNKKWRFPVFFLCFTFVLAAFILITRSQSEGALLVAATLAVMGVGFPFAYIVSFFLSARKHIRVFGLDGQNIVYNVLLEDKDIVVTQDKQIVRIGWVSMYRAVRFKTCIALYAVPTRAYLLPAGEMAEDADEIWKFLKARFPEDKTRDYRFFM